MKMIENIAATKQRFGKIYLNVGELKIKIGIVP
jgi:hypothetical protein